jgi:hypothetical protein
MNFQSKKKGFAAIMAFLIILSAFLSPIKSYAHANYFFQVLIDENQYAYQGNILSDKADWASNEAGHMEAQLGDFSSLVKDNYVLIPDKNQKVEETKVSGKQNLPFSFNPIEQGTGWFDNKPVNHATKEDVNRAYFVKDTLLTGLNDALRILNNNKPFGDINELLTSSTELSTAIKQVANGSTAYINGFSIRQGRASYSKEPEIDKKTGISKNDYITMSKTVDGESVEYEFIYRVVKGYSEKGNWDNYLYSSSYKYSDDTKYITWNMAMYQAVYSYSAKGMTAMNGGEIAKPGQLEEMVAWMFESLYNGIRNLLGLFDLGELIFNEGVRGSAAWHYGAMPMAWEQNVQLYHWIFQLLAWTIISFSIAKLLFTRNLSTINPSMRVSLIAGIQDLMITGLILAFTMPIINLLLNINSKVVDIFAAIGPDLDSVMGVNNYSSMLAGIVVQFFFLFIVIYLNFTYIIRSITIAILTAMAPLFVVTLSLGGRWKGLFGQWMKELVSTIYLQSFHAFILGFLFVSSTSSRGIESIVVCFSLIPLTEFFRKMMMGQSGEMSSRLGMGAVVSGASMAMGATQKATSVGNKRVQNSNGQSNSGSQSSGGYKSENGVNATNGMSDMKTGNSDTLRNRNGSGSGSVAVESRTKHQDQRNSQLQRQVPFDVANKGTDSKEYKEYMGGSVMSEAEAKMADRRDNLKNDVKNTLSGDGLKKMAVGAGNIAMGATTMMAGAGFALAFGGIAPQAAATGANMIGSGGRKAYQVGKAGISKVAPSVGTGVVLAGKAAGRGVGQAHQWVENKRLGQTGQPSSGQTAESVAGQTIKPVTNQSNGQPSKPISGTVKSQQEGSASGSAQNYTSLSENIGQRSIGNDGDYQVFRDGVALSERGIVRASENSNGTSIYSYDTMKLSDGDKKNINGYANVFESKDKAQIEHLQQKGVESAWKNHDGSVGVAYNQVGKEKLGIQKVETIGGNIVETKRANQSSSTKISFDVPPMKTGQGVTVNGGVVNGDIVSVGNTNKLSETKNKSKVPTSQNVNGSKVQINNGIQINGGNVNAGKIVSKNNGKN